MKKGDLFPLAEAYQHSKRRNLRVEWTGEYREPQKGDWFISGAIPEGYLSPAALDFKYHIGRLVEVKETVIVEVVRVIEKEDKQS